MKLGETIKCEGHLFVVCSGPLLLPRDSVVAFNFTEKDWDSDATCIVQPGEHEYIRKESVIAYAHGQLLTPQHIAGLKVLQGVEYPPVKPELLLRIQEGVFKSLDNIPPKLIKAMYCFAAETLANSLRVS